MVEEEREGADVSVCCQGLVWIPHNHLQFGLITSRNTHMHAPTCTRTQARQPNYVPYIPLPLCLITSDWLKQDMASPGLSPSYEREHSALTPPARVCNCNPQRFHIITALTVRMCSCSGWNICMLSYAWSLTSFDCCLSSTVYMKSI